MKDNLISLSIESSCDETAAAVLINGREVLSNVIASQIETHKAYGGVVPEIASRKHIEAISQTIEEALEKSGKTFDDLDFVTVTQGPGLVGALLVGISAAKAIALAKNIPLVGVNHMEGHISANYIEHKDLEPPFVSLIVSGGHTYLLDVKDYGEYTLLGRTRDDAAGEAFDKVARALGLPYPGGPLIDKLAKENGQGSILFPRSYLEEGSYDFSFSGLKTAVLNYVNQEKQKGNEINIKDIAASFQEAVVEVLVQKSIKLAKELNRDKIVVAGGVAANTSLREGLISKCKAENLKAYFPSLGLCTDNAAMIGSAGFYRYINNEISNLDMKVDPNLKMHLK